MIIETRNGWSNKAMGLGSHDLIYWSCHYHDKRIMFCYDFEAVVAIVKGFIVVVVSRCLVCWKLFLLLTCSCNHKNGRHAAATTNWGFPVSAVTAEQVHIIFSFQSLASIKL